MSGTPSGVMLWRATCPVHQIVIEVDLYDHAWEHAVEGHADVAPHLKNAKIAIEKPSAIYQSNTRQDSVVFFNHSVTDSIGQVLAVPVIVKGFSGIVTSVHFRTANYSGSLLWKP
jgi:hypothetical protein